jgi:ATP-dependent RNA helicase SUPV3L1/SUV3
VFGPEAPPAVEEIAAPSVTLLPNVAFASEPSVEAKPEPESTGEAATETAAVEAPQEQAATEIASENAAVSEAAPADAAAAPAEPELVEVWRPGGRSEERRPPRHDRNRHRRSDRPTDSTQPAAAGEAATGETGEAAKRQRHRHGRRNQEFRKPRTDAPAEGAVAVAADGAPALEPRDDKGRPSRQRFEGKPRGEARGDDRNKGKFRGDRDKGGRDKGGRDKGGRDRDKGGRESGPSHRQYATSASPRERDRPIDPNSPFAKLAALKEQLAANRKD